MRRATHLVVVWFLVGCGAVHTSSGSDSSAATTVSPIAASPSPSSGLAFNDCTAAPSGSRTQFLGRDGVSIQVPAGWTQGPGDAQSETLLLQVNAPPTYGPSSVVVQLHSLLGPRRGSSSINEANLDTARWTNPSNANPRTAAGPAVSCAFGGEQAAFVQFAYGSTIEIRIYVLHHADQQFPFLYEVVVDSNGAIDRTSIGDVKSMLGSWTWQQ
jgi:hypothetical protein